MPGTAHPRGDEMRHIQWLAIFADREEPRARIDQLLRELAGQGVATRPSKPILQFYGVGGQGKSSLLDKTRSEASARFPKTHFASLDLADLDPSRVAEPVAVLWSLTDALAKAGIMAPLPLCLYIHYWRKQNPAPGVSRRGHASQGVFGALHPRLPNSVSVHRSAAITHGQAGRAAHLRRLPRGEGEICQMLAESSDEAA